VPECVSSDNIWYWTLECHWKPNLTYITGDENKLETRTKCIGNISFFKLLNGSNLNKSPGFTWQ